MQTASAGDLPTRIRIRKVLLAGNPYDGFLLEDAGFRPPGQDEPEDAPSFDLAGTGSGALRLLEEGGYDMLLADTMLPDMSGGELAAKVRQAWPKLPIALITSDTDLGGASEEPQPPAAANLFIWYGSALLLQSLIRLHEDEINAPALLASGRSLVILLVEDEPNFYSHFVPLVYDRIRTSSLELMPRERHPSQPWGVIDSRPLVLLRRNFEDACEVLYRYRTQLLALITDMRFPVHGELKGDAGLRLLYRARSINGHLPVAVHSRERAHREAVIEARAQFFWKDSPRLLYELEQFLTNFCGFGPFVFRWPAGDRYGVAHTLAELSEILADVPDVVFEHHGLHFDFSTWLAVHGYQDLAHRVRELSITESDPRLKVLALIDEELERS